MKPVRIFSVLLAVLLVLTACGDDDTAAPSTTEATPSSPTSAAEAVATTTPTSEYTEDELARIEEAERRARAYVDAINDGRVDDIAEITGVPLRERDVKQWEFHAILNASGVEWRLGDCDVAATSSTTVKLECHFEYTEPVFVAIGAGEAIFPFTLVGEQLTGHSWVSLGHPFTDALFSYVTYLETFYPDDYALCDPRQQVGEFSEHGGMARVPECAPVMVEHAPDVVAWIEAGKPTE